MEEIENNCFNVVLFCLVNIGFSQALMFFRYIIPVPIINHFLEDVEERNKYIGFCSLGLTCQATENAQLREHLKMPSGLTGVLVNKIQKLTDTNQWIKKDDVLLAFDGVPIANDGTGKFFSVGKF